MEGKNVFFKINSEKPPMLSKFFTSILYFLMQLFLWKKNTCNLVLKKLNYKKKLKIKIKIYLKNTIIIQS